jgi:hypothetical protein
MQAGPGFTETADRAVSVRGGRVSACRVDFSSRSRTLPGHFFSRASTGSSAKMRVAEVNPNLQEFCDMAYRSHYRSSDTSGWTYFIEAPDLKIVKIGAAKDLVPRFHSIQVCSPVDLVLAAAINGRGQEPGLHRRFEEWRVRGEWYDSGAPGLRELMEKYKWVGR